MPPPNTHFPSGASLDGPVTSASIDSIALLANSGASTFASVSGTWPTVSSFAETFIAFRLCKFSGSSVHVRISPGSEQLRKN